MIDLTGKTLLVTGSDFNYEQGMGSVEVGMYVAPKLYISYGIGLFVVRTLVDFVGRYGFAPFAFWRIWAGAIGLLAMWLY